MNNFFKKKYIFIYILITCISVTSAYFLYKKYNVNRPMSAKLVINFYYDQENESWT